ncbi:MULTISPECIES: MFS transporter [unclassified Ochrobactrum]|uniref:MFS transporter n=1 Tax=unclassified Ochrobactrum TaxID=239106 RepID=UPI0030AE46A1
MISARLASFLAQRNIHYGWVVAGVTFLTMLATAAAMGSAGILIEPLQSEFGWTNANISFAMALRLVLFGLMGPFAAAFMNQFGLRRVVMAALIMISFGLVGSIFMTEQWQMVALWGVVIGLGTGMTALVLGATVAARWFEKRRGLVVGMMTASNATGQLIFMPILASVSQNIGWRSSLIIVISFLLAALVLVLILMRDKPSDIGLKPYGRTAPMPAPEPKKQFGAMLLSPLVTLREASSTTTFWVLFLTFFVCGFSTNGLIQTHWIALCGDYGIVPVGAAGILAVIGAFDLIGTIASGWLTDRYDNRWLLFWFYALRGLSLIYLTFTDFSIYELALFAVFYGLDWVATVPPTVKLAAEQFGPEKAGMVFGWVFTGHQVGAAAAAAFAGFVRTDYDSYTPALILAGAMCFAAAAMVFLINRPKLQAAFQAS